MRIKALNGFGLGYGNFAVKDDVVTVDDHFGHQLLRLGWAVESSGEIVNELPTPPAIVTRDPEPTNRDPKVTKGGRR